MNTNKFTGKISEKYTKLRQLLWGIRSICNRGNKCPHEIFFFSFYLQNYMSDQNMSDQNVVLFFHSQ